jgi:hypothetical protein
MEKLVQIWHKAVQSVFSKMSTEEQKQIHGPIYKRLEMPKEWLKKAQTEAYRGPHPDLTPEMVEKRVQIVLAKTLLVYERLNAFYM